MGQRDELVVAGALCRALGNQTGQGGFNLRLRALQVVSGDSPAGAGLSRTWKPETFPCRLEICCN